jgi:hypothetical protein
MEGREGGREKETEIKKEGAKGRQLKTFSLENINKSQGSLSRKS